MRVSKWVKVSAKFGQEQAERLVADLPAFLTKGGTDIKGLREGQ